MSKDSPRNALCLALLLVSSLIGMPTRAADSPLATARALVDAFNRHDPEAMAALVSSDFELYYVDDKGAAALALRGPEQLAEEMRGYFSQRPDVRSTMTGTIDGPTFVAFREQIVGGRSSLAVYEVREGRIQRVWYFPAEDATPAAPSDEPPPE